MSALYIKPIIWRPWLPRARNDCASCAKEIAKGTKSSLKIVSPICISSVNDYLGFRNLILSPWICRIKRERRHLHCCAKTTEWGRVPIAALTAVPQWNIELWSDATRGRLMVWVVLKMPLLAFRVKLKFISSMIAERSCEAWVYPLEKVWM